MNKLAILLSIFALCNSAEASWYWPFGGGENKSKMRVSSLIEPASLLIDEASDLSAEGKVSEAVSKYRAALDELDRIEAENADRVGSAAFATLRNKRAYVNAAIDSLLLKDAQQNARAVSVSDTTELEKRLAAERAAARGETAADAAVNPAEGEKASRASGANIAPADSARRARLEAELAKNPRDRRIRLRLVAEDIRARRYDDALDAIDKLLSERANDPAALNLRAAVETETGDYARAERTLDQSIRNNPQSHYAYYNMARLILMTRGERGRTAARGYYEAGRKRGGPEDRALEARL